MFITTSLLTFVTLALSVTAKTVIIDRSPVLSVPLTRIQNINSGQKLVDAGLIRAQNFKDRITPQDLGELRKRQSVPVSNDGTTYIASVGVGEPATQYQLLVDTGSSNTWVGADQPYTETSTSVETEDGVSVSYGSGEFSGTEYIDRVTLAPELVINSQSIGVAFTSSGFEGVDGILGIGPTTLTEDTVENESVVPTVTDNLFSQRTISQRVVGISFEPTNTSELVANGELTFGGTNSSKYTGDITYTISPGPFWGISQSISYGGTIIQSITGGIVDTGTTLLLLSTNALTSYIRAVGGLFDTATGLYTITPTQYNNLKNLVFNINGTDFALTPNAQIWPRSLNTAIGGTADKIYLVVADLGPATGNGVDFIDGYVFLERFYSVFATDDLGVQHVGFANTPFTSATIN